MFKDKYDMNYMNDIAAGYISAHPILSNYTALEHIQDVKRSHKFTENVKYIAPHFLAIDKDNRGGKLYLRFANNYDKVHWVDANKERNIYEMISNESVKPYYDIDFKLKDHITDDVLNEFRERGILTGDDIGNIKEPITGETEPNTELKERLFLLQHTQKNPIENGISQAEYKLLTLPYISDEELTELKQAKYKTDEELKEITDSLITNFNKHFGTTITHENILCYVKRDTCPANKSASAYTNKIKSIHIVVNGFKAEKTELKKFAIQTNKTNTGYIFDVAVYTKNRLFSLPHQTKFDKEQYFEWAHIYDGDEDKYTNKDITYKVLINDVDKCVSIKKNINDSETVVVPAASETITLLSGNIEPVILNPSNAVKLLQQHLPNEFYNDDKLWKSLTCQMVLHEWDNWELFLETSSEKSSKYSVEDNTLWANNCNVKYITSHINKRLAPINDKYNKGLIWDDVYQFTADVNEWIQDTADITEAEMSAVILNFKQEHGKPNSKPKPDDSIFVGNGYYYQYNRALLVNEFTKKAHHYGMDSGFKIDGKVQYQSHKFGDKVIKQNELKGATRKFLETDKQKVCFIRVLWGGGKTHFCVQEIYDYAVENGLSILFITENNQLNTEVSNKFKAVSHLDPKLKGLMTNAMAVTSEESVEKIIRKRKGKKFDIIIWDEYESLINHLFSNKTFTSAKTDTFSVSMALKELCLQAKKVICLDCDLSKDRMDILLNAFKRDNQEVEAEMIYCDTNIWDDYMYNWHISGSQMEEQMNNEFIKEGKRIIYASGSRKDVANTYNALITKMGDEVTKNLLMINKDGVFFYIKGVRYDAHRHESRIEERLTESKRLTPNLETLKKLDAQIKLGKFAGSDKKTMMEELESFIINNNIVWFGFSPSIKCGISIGNNPDNKLFDKVYGSVKKESVCGREYNQMFHRCRQLADKEINIHIATGIGHTKRLSVDEDSERMLETNNSLRLNKNLWWNATDVDIDKVKMDPFYRDITMTNFKEHLNSTRCLGQEIIGPLMNVHGMKVTLIYPFETNKLILDSDMLWTTKRLEGQRWGVLDTIEYQNTDIPSEIEFKTLSDNKLVNNSAVPRRKYRMMSQYNINHSMNKFLIAEQKSQVEFSTLWENNEEAHIISGIFTNWIVDKISSKPIFYRGHTVNKYYLIKKFDSDIRQYVYSHIYVTKRGKVVKSGEGWCGFPLLLNGRERFSQHRIYSGPLRPQRRHPTPPCIKPMVERWWWDDGGGDDVCEMYHFGGHEYAEEVDGVDDECDITYEPYCKQPFVEHSGTLLDIESFVGGNLRALTYDDSAHNAITNESQFSLTDCQYNRNKIINSLLVVLKIDKTDLIYNRKILTNNGLKELLDKGKDWVDTEFKTYVNWSDPHTSNLKPFSFTNFNSSNRYHYTQVKSQIIRLLGIFGIAIYHLNKNGNAEKDGNNGDKCFLVIQYVLNISQSGLLHIQSTVGRTKATTYYGLTINDIYKFRTGKERPLHEYIKHKDMIAQMTSTKKKSRRPEMLFETRRGSIYKRNNFITYEEVKKTAATAATATTDAIAATTTTTPYTIKLPFNLETAKFLPLDIKKIKIMGTWLMGNIETEFSPTNNTDCSHVIDLRNKSLKERIDTIIQIEHNVKEPKYEIKDYTTKTNDIKFKTYDDICWVSDDTGWKKTIVRKATSNLNMKDKTLDNTIIISPLETTHDIIKSVIDELIDEVVVVVEHNECKEKIIASINVINNKDTVKTRFEKLIGNFQNDIDGIIKTDTEIDEPISEEQQNNSEYIKHLTYSSYDEFSHIFRPNIVVNN